MPELVADNTDYLKKKQAEQLGNSMFAPLDFAALIGREPPKRDWVIQDWLPRGVVTALYGQGGVGKSLLAQQLATAVASGNEWLGSRGARGLVMGLFCEDDHNEIWRRQLALCAHYGVQLESVAAFLELDARMGKDNLMAQEVQRALVFTAFMDHVHTLAKERMPMVLIVDNIAQVFGANENDRTMATQFVNRLARIALDAHCAVLLLGHPSRMQGSEYSGSSGWDAAVRSRWLLERVVERVNGKDEPTGQLMLKKLKANYSQQDSLILEWESGAYALVDGGGMVTDIRRRKRDEDAETGIVAGLSALIAQGVRSSASANSRSAYLPKQIEARGFAPGCGRRSLEQAMDRLMAAGRIKTDHRRNERTRKVEEWLVLVDPPKP